VLNSVSGWLTPVLNFSGLPASHGSCGATLGVPWWLAVAACADAEKDKALAAAIAEQQEARAAPAEASKAHAHSAVPASR